MAMTHAYKWHKDMICTQNQESSTIESRSHYRMRTHNKTKRNQKRRKDQSNLTYFQGIMC